MNKLLFFILAIVFLFYGCDSSTNKVGNNAPEESSVEGKLKEKPEISSKVDAEVKQQAVEGMSDTVYFISGTEPFWAMAVGKNMITYTSADGDTLQFKNTKSRHAQGRMEDHVLVYDLGEQRKLIMNRGACPCSDGMSDKEYKYEAVVILKDKILEGCANPK